MYNNNWHPVSTDHAVRYATHHHEGDVIAEVRRVAVETWTASGVDGEFHNMYHAQKACESVLSAQADARNPVKLAIAAGVRDESYDTVANGYVRRYSGEATITLDGVEYHAVGFGPEGTPEFVYRQGGIRFTPVDGGAAFVR